MEFIDGEQGLEIIKEYLPLLKALEDRGIEYCLVGGLGVMSQELRAGMGTVRLTEDADILVPNTLRVSEFAEIYLDTYSRLGTSRDALYEALFATDSFADLDAGYDSTNFSIIGANEAIDGFATPSFDVCKRLNEKTVDGIDRDRIELAGQAYWVATVGELLDMKQRTASLYRATPSETRRPQDFADMTSLRKLSGSPSDDETEEELGPLQRLAKRWLG